MVLVFILTNDNIPDMLTINALWTTMNKQLTIQFLI